MRYSNPLRLRKKKKFRRSLGKKRRKQKDLFSHAGRRKGKRSTISFYRGGGYGDRFQMHPSGIGRRKFLLIEEREKKGLIFPEGGKRGKFRARSEF